jgi:hypothetical protein
LFERYTERARRSIFFARYESSQFGSPEITSADLLLGVLREDKTVVAQLGGFETLTAIRREVEQLAPKRQKVSTSVDLPLSQELKRVLAFAAEEAERLNHRHIDSSHLVLGLLREEDSLAAKLLRKYGMTLEKCREIARQALPESTPPERVVVFERREPAPVAPPGTPLESAIYDLRQLVNNTETRLRGYADPYGDRRLHGKSWSRKEALGHLIDWAIAHERWVTQVLMESKLVGAAYPDEAAVTVQHYADFPWPETVDLWALLNRLLIHVLARVPGEKLEVPCRVGTADPVPLSTLVEIYIEHCEDIVAQILAPSD